MRRSLLALALVLAGCSTGPSSHALLKAELVRLQTPTSTAPLGAAGIVGGTPASLYNWSSNLTITSYRGPVGMITLTGAGQDVIVYECTQPSSDNCLVELNGPALQNLIGTTPVTVPPTTYDRVRMIYCKPPETGYHAYLSASAAIGGSTWYTKTLGNLSATGPAEPVQLSHQGCVKDYAIFPPLVVTDTITVPIQLRLYFDVREVGYAALGDPSTNQLFTSHFGCTPVATLGVTPYVCDSYPDVAAVSGTVLPTEERYLVNGGALIGLFFDSSDRFVGGFLRRHLDDGVNWNPHFFPDSYVDVLSANGDGSYRLHQVSGANFPAFRRASHSGTATEVTGNAFAYTAVRLP